MLLPRPLTSLIRLPNTFTRSVATKSMTHSSNQFPTTNGEFLRKASSFRDVISDEKDAKFPAEKGRYHLYVSLACPWAHRTLIVRALKGLEDVISVSVTNYLMLEKGWSFPTAEETLDVPGATVDEINSAKFIRDLYFKANSNYDGRFTVPVLWDKKLGTIVNNESSEIMRMLNTTFDNWAKRPNLTFYPVDHRGSIDAVNDWVYDDINNGVYKSGFATTQEAYELNCKKLFAALDKVEDILSKQEWLGAPCFSEADIRLFTTVLRFDPVYHTHFKCNLKTIADNYPNTLRWARKIYQLPGIAETCNMDHIKRHYFCSHKSINPNGVFGLWNGPDLSSPKVTYKAYPL